jgi:multiple sugar transport system ATP-binding protein
MARIHLDKLTKVFPGGVRAVDGVDLAIADREFVVLVGPSGCGKSTTLRMIAGLEDVTAGTIRIGDRVVNDVPPQERDVAVVFQNYALYPHLTVFGNLAFALRLRRVAKDEIHRRVVETARLLEIEHLLDRKPRALSGGQRQRVALGRAIVRRPAAFLLDEPLSNLDAQLRVSTRAELKRLHRAVRTTTVYVTHDQEEAMSLGDRVVVMKDGVVQQADSPLETYLRPVNRFVAGFIGSPPMNFFHGAILHDGATFFFEERAPSGSPHSASAAGRAGAPCVAGLKTAPLSASNLTPGLEGFTLTLPPHLCELLGGHVGRAVVLGIRPEHLALRVVADASPESGGANVIRANVNVVELLGRDMDVYLNTNLHEHLVARVDAQRFAADVRTDARVELTVDPSSVHVFEPGETGMNLSVKGGRNSAAPTTEPAHAIA